MVALDTASGKVLLQQFDSGVVGRGANRSVIYWSSGADSRIFAAVQSFIYAIDARTGKLMASFGKDGRIDLRENLGRDPEKQSVVETTPGIIYKDLLIVGGRMPEALPAPPGDIRAYDVRTGALRWTFHTIPHPGEPGYETWPKDAWTYTGAANNWAGMALDDKRGIVYVPTGSAATDFYGADRLGDDPLCKLPDRTERRNRPAHLAFSSREARRLGSRFSLAAHPRHREAQRENGGRRRPDQLKHGFVFLFRSNEWQVSFPIESKRAPQPAPFPANSPRQLSPCPQNPSRSPVNY